MRSPFLILVLALCSTGTLLLTNCASPLSAGLPNLGQAFTKSLLVNKADGIPNKKSYTYMTSKNFPAAKTEFANYIGDEWFSVQSTPEIDKRMEDSMKKNIKSPSKSKFKVNGSVLYLNSKYPDARLIMVHASTSEVLNLIVVSYEYMLANQQ